MIASSCFLLALRQHKIAAGVDYLAPQKFLFAESGFVMRDRGVLFAKPHSKTVHTGFLSGVCSNLKADCRFFQVSLPDTPHEILLSIRRTYYLF
jgi:hypothetical protein